MIKKYHLRRDGIKLKGTKVLLYDVDFDILSAKSDSLCMGIEGQVDTVPPDAIADIRCNSLAIAGNKEMRAERDDRWIDRGYAPAHKLPCCRMLRQAGILCAVGRGRKIHDMAVMLCRRGLILLPARQDAIRTVTADAINGESMILLECLDCLDGRFSADAISASHRIPLLLEQGLDLTHGRPPRAFAHEDACKSRSRKPDT